MQLLRPQHWKDYELIDSGDYEKLERFGKYIIRRPEPQAVWRKSLPEKEWEDAADATFKKEKGKTSETRHPITVIHHHYHHKADGSPLA